MTDFLIISKVGLCSVLQLFTVMLFIETSVWSNVLGGVVSNFTHLLII